MAETTTDIDALANDIRAIDGKHELGAGELAEKLIELGWTKGGKAEYPYESGPHIILGPEIFAGAEGTNAEGVISWKGENFYRTHDGKPPVVREEKQLTLKDFREGEQVEVFKNGDFLPGFIQSRDKVSGHLHVHTDRGPVTVATPTHIRKRS